MGQDSRLVVTSRNRDNGLVPNFRLSKHPTLSIITNTFGCLLIHRRPPQFI